MTHATLKAAGAPVVPVIRYRNLQAAIDWLSAAFGFERHRITTDSAGVIVFAQLTLGGAMVMLSPVRESAFDRLLKQPDEIGGAETQVCYFFIADAHAHCAGARAAGAEIIFDIEDRAKGGRSYSCRDPEGHLWNFGTYDPWHHQEKSTAVPRELRWVRRGWSLAFATGAVVALGLATFTVGWVLKEQRPPSFSNIETGSISSGYSTTQQAILPTENRGFGQAPVPNSAEEKHKAAITQAEQTIAALRERFTQAVSERVSAEQAAQAARDQLAKALSSKATAERATREARRQLARVRATRPQSRNVPLPQQ